MIVVYDGPIHQSIQSPSDAEIEELVFNTDQDYWLYGSGEGEIRIDAKGVYLGLKKLMPYGMRLLFKDSSDDPLMVAVSSDDFSELVSVFSGGEYTDEPVSHFIALEVACRAITQFCHTGSRPANVEWREWTNFEMDE